MIISILAQTCSSGILVQQLMTDSSLTVLILVGGIAIGLVIGIGLGAFYFGLRFWYRTDDRIQAENLSAGLPLVDYQNSESMQLPPLISENMMHTKPCVKCGKALPLDAHYCSECRKEQNYS